MSRLSTRIMAIMLFPLVLFFVGLFSIDQYRTTLIRSEFTALERQGFTLARSLALAQSERQEHQPICLSLKEFLHLQTRFCSIL